MNVDALPRFGSFPDMAEAATSVSTVVADLARLADMTTVPRVIDNAAWAELTPQQRWMASVVKLGMCVQAILDMSPLAEEETLRLLATLVSKRIVTCAPRPTH